MPCLHGIRDTVMRDKVRTRLYKEPRKDKHFEETSGKSKRKKQQYKGPRCKMAATYEEGEVNWQQHQREKQGGIV
jgi:hypothetical protein